MNTANRAVVRTSRWEPEVREGRSFSTHGISLSRRASGKPHARYNTNKSQAYHAVGVLVCIVVCFVMFLNAVSK